MTEKYVLKCIECGKKYSAEKVIYRCPKCNDLLTVEYLRYPSLDSLKKWSKRPLSVWRYREVLPISTETEPITLGEGGTGLHKCDRLGEALGLKHIYVKNEGENPTGSFKDRGMTVGVTRALELKADYVACASTGNTAASLSAYAAKAGIKALVIIPSGKVALGKLIQSVVHGAKVIQIKGNFDDALNIIIKLCEMKRMYILNSLNPYRLEGQKTLAFEVRDQLYPEVPEVIIVPVGNAGNISAIWKGFKELEKLGLIEKKPKMIGIQAERAAPLAQAFRKGLDEIENVASPETIATAIRIGAPVNWKKALRAVKESNGLIETVSDTEILNAQKELASKEGIFVEPASASSIAGLKKLREMGMIDPDERVVCVTTGHGLKDPQIVLDNFPDLVTVNADLKEILKMI